MFNLGQLYGFTSKNNDELQVLQEALDEVRGDFLHASTLQLQVYLSTILTIMGKMHVSQYSSQIANVASGDKGKCTVAIALCEEALSILRTHLQYGMAAQTLTVLASAHSNFDMFDEARSTLKEALDLSCRYNGKESTEVAVCHQRMAFICQEQAEAIRKQVDMHLEYMLINSMRHYHSRGSRVLVEGLQKNQQYKGIEGVVVKMDALRLCVRLDTLDNKELMLKPENVCPLFPTACGCRSCWPFQYRRV